jgi:hypothetical protein
MAEEAMTLAQALKRKNRLAQAVGDARQRAAESNSVIKGNTPPFSVRDEMAASLAASESLVKLKAAISRANEPIQEDIYRLAEAKGHVTWLKALNVSQGRVAPIYGGEAMDYEAQIGAQERAELIAAAEARVDEIQNRLNLHTVQTVIEVDLD